MGRSLSFNVVCNACKRHLSRSKSTSEVDRVCWSFGSLGEPLSVNFKSRTPAVASSAVFSSFASRDPSASSLFVLFCWSIDVSQAASVKPESSDGDDNKEECPKTASSKKPALGT